MTLQLQWEIVLPYLCCADIPVSNTQNRGQGNTVGFNAIRTGKILFLAQNSVQTSYANSIADITHIKSVLFSSAVIFFLDCTRV